MFFLHGPTELVVLTELLSAVYCKQRFTVTTEPKDHLRSSRQARPMPTKTTWTICSSCAKKHFGPVLPKLSRLVRQGGHALCSIPVLVCMREQRIRACIIFFVRTWVIYRFYSMLKFSLHLLLGPHVFNYISLPSTFLPQFELNRRLRLDDLRPVHCQRPCPQTVDDPKMVIHNLRMSMVVSCTRIKN